jgi:eukaryotic-like serine/threonine-protein kinase
MKIYTPFLLLILVTELGFSQKVPQVDFEKTPVVQWKFKIKQPVFSSPVISEGTVYVGGLDSTLYALELSTGNVKWKLKTNGELRSTVAIEGTKVYLLGGNGVLSCIDKNTGKPVWRSVFDNTALFLAERRYDFADYFHSSPVVNNGVVYFGTGNGRFNAVSADNGETIWSFKAGDIIHNTPVITKDKIYFGCFDGFVYALDIRSGQVVWKFKSVGQQYFPNGEMQGSPSLGHGSIFIGGRDYNLYAVNSNGGYANWNRKFQAGWALSTTVQDTVLYVGTSDDRLLLALDARTGHELWKTNVKFNIFGGCAFTTGMVYVGSIWGKLFGIDKKTGAIRWAFDTDGYTTNHLKYFKSDDTFRDDIGAILRSPIEWIGAEYKMGGIFSTPAISGNTIVISSTEGVVYCLRRS